MLHFHQDGSRSYKFITEYIWFARTLPILLELIITIISWMSAYTYIYLFSSWTSLKELCLQLRRLFCIKIPQRLQQSFQRLTDTIPHSAMSLGISKNNNCNKRGDVNAFFWDQASLEWLYKLLYYLECSYKFCLTFFSLSFILLVLSLPVCTEIGTLEVLWNIHF